MTEETKKDRTPEEMWADWARKEITDQAAALKELRRFKRETEKDLRRFKKYSAALEEEIKGLHKQLAEAREDANDNAEYHDAERKRLKAALDLVLKIANAYPHDGSACAHIAERALAGDDAAEEWERLGKEIDAEAEKANVIGIWEFKQGRHYKQR